VRDAAGDTESALLHEAVPSWVADVVIDRNIPRFIKIPFFLLPHPMMVKQDRMKKVCLDFYQSLRRLNNSF
jgi:WD repeat-containing protein 48